MAEVDYGPLTQLIGVWEGDEGLDVAPEPDGFEENPYYETLTFEAAGDVSNAETETLAILRYHQVVSRKSNDEVFHDQIGYWTWEPSTQTITQSILIPRVVAVLAGGTYTADPHAKDVVLEVKAAAGDGDWGILESPFLRDNARSTAFEHRLEVAGDRLKYFETTSIEIYGHSFAHTDTNALHRRG